MVFPTKNYYMGGNSGFSKWINGSISKLKKPPDMGFGWFISQNLQGMPTTIFVDMSVLLHAVHAISDLGFRSFVQDPCNSVEDLVDRYKSLLRGYLEPILDLLNVSLVFVFEKGSAKFGKRQSRRLNQGVRNAFLKSFHGSKRLGRKSISMAIGLPPLFVQRAIGRWLSSFGGVVFARGESDTTIFQMALEVKERDPNIQVFVFSTDSDYLIFSDHVDGLIGPIRSKR